MADPQVLKTGLAFGESPRWHQDRLWLADWGTQEIIAVDLDGGGCPLPSPSARSLPRNACRSAQTPRRRGLCSPAACWRPHGSAGWRTDPTRHNFE